MHVLDVPSSTPLLPTLSTLTTIKLKLSPGLITVSTLIRATPPPPRKSMEHTLRTRHRHSTTSPSPPRKSMEHTLRTRHRPSTTSPSPRLVRSRSGAENRNSNSLDHSQRFLNRSKSTTRSRNSKNEFENNISHLLTNTTSASSKQKKLSNSNIQDTNSKDGFVRFLQRGSPHNSGTPKRLKSALGSTSPSAWALSPGRAARKVVNTPAAAEPAAKVNGEKAKGKSGGMNGVFKYFRQKKVCPMQEEEYHRFRIMHSRLLQWRFSNAKADAIMASFRFTALDKMFHVMLRIISKRNKLLEMRVENQKLKHDIKLCRILNPQMKMLNEWAKLDAKNCEAVSRVTRKLSALSHKLPLDDDVKGDEKSIHEAMSDAIAVMDNIEKTIAKFLSELEKKLYLLTELTSTIEHQNEMMEEMEKIVILVSNLLAWEKSSRAILMQVMSENTQQCLRTKTCSIEAR